MEVWRESSQTKNVWKFQGNILLSIVIFLKKMLLYKKEAKYPVLDKVEKNTC